jgi:hypothetical protein
VSTVSKWVKQSQRVYDWCFKRRKHYVTLATEFQQSQAVPAPLSIVLVIGSILKFIGRMILCEPCRKRWKKKVDDHPHNNIPPQPRSPHDDDSPSLPTSPLPLLPTATASTSTTQISSSSTTKRKAGRSKKNSTLHDDNAPISPVDELDSHEVNSDHTSLVRQHNQEIQQVVDSVDTLVESLLRISRRAKKNSTLYNNNNSEEIERKELNIAFPPAPRLVGIEENPVSKRIQK